MADNDDDRPPANTPPPPEDLGLDDVLRALSLELDAARKETEKRGGGYGLGVAQAEVELTVAITRAKTTDGGAAIKFGVLSWLGLDLHAQAESQHTSADTHRIKLTLTPVVQVQPAVTTPIPIANGVHNTSPIVALKAPDK